MLLAEKLAAFHDRQLGAEQVVRAQDATAAGTRQPHLLQGCLFEAGADPHSPIIKLTAPVFWGGWSYANLGGYFRDNLFVGRYCSIGRRVSIGAAGHHIDGVTSFPSLAMGAGSRPYSAQDRAELGLGAPLDLKPTILHSDVWVGDGAVVRAGVVIGPGAVIGANAVVTKDVAPYAIVAGAPARVLRYRFAPAVIAALLDSRWWDYPHATLQGLPMGHVRQFLDCLGTMASPAPLPTLSLESPAA
jgi:virginiamycin A acetyltransferase